MPCHVIEMHTETIWNLRIFAVEDSRFSASSSVPLRSHGQPVVCYDSQPAIVNYGLQVATASALKPFDMRKFAFSMVSIGILWMVSEGEEKQVLLFSPQRAPECLCFIPDWMQSRFHWKSYKWIGRPWLHSAATVLGAPRHAKHGRCDETFL